MGTHTEHDIKVLNGLIETTIDSADGYDQAAKDADQTRYASLFASRAGERRRVATELQRLVGSLGGKPEDDGTILASAHRIFVNLRSSLSKGDEAVVAEVERGEDHIKHKYEDALEDEKLSPSTRSAIELAYRSIREGHDQMRDLKHAMQHA